MDEKAFAKRLTQLRMQRNVSAREMSLAIGQNPSYINRIENGLNFPSMQSFFYICEYLGITPAQFFDAEIADPGRSEEAIRLLKRLTGEQLALITALMKELSN